MYKQILIIFILIYIVLYLLVPVGSFSHVLFDVSLAVVVLAVAFFFRYSQKGLLKSQWAKPSNFLLISYLVVNMQCLLDYRLGLKNIYSDLIKYPFIFNQCVILVVVGLLAFVLGYCKSTYSINRQKVNVTLRNFSVGKKSLFFISTLQFLFFGLFLANVNVVDFFIGKAHVGGTRETTLANYFEALLYVSNVVLVVVVIFGKKEIGSIRQYLTAFPFFSFYLMLIYMLLRMVSGDRGPFIQTTLLLFYGYLYIVRKRIKLIYIVGILFAGAVYINLIGIARSMDAESQSFSERISTAADSFSQDGRFANKEGSTVFSSTEELAGSFLVNQIAVNDIVNRQGSYQYGAYQLFGILNTIPFISGFIAQQMNLNGEQISSSERANYLYLGRQRTWGVGSSMLADFYWDLGIIGVVVGMFFAGLVFHYIDHSLFVENKSYVSTFALTFCLMYAAASIYIPRSTLIFVLKPIVWGWVILWFIIPKKEDKDKTEGQRMLPHRRRS